MSEDIDLTIFVKGYETEVGTSALLAEDVGKWISDQDPSVSMSLVRVDKTAMDFGTGLALIFAAPAIVEVGKGIQRGCRLIRTAKLL